MKFKMVNLFQTQRRFYPVSFVISIIWIAAFSYLMLWWTNEIGKTLGVRSEVRSHAVVDQ